MHHQDHQAPSQAGAVRNQGVQAQEPRARPIRQAFVTGATGLLGNNLVRELAARGIAVRALARSVDKARQQFADLPQVQVVKGDMGEVGAFAAALAGCDVVFHAAAHFRDSYKGGATGTNCGASTWTARRR
ncbi:NAD(P)H-binding protein [Achromobacter xylosoxidans]